MGIMCCCMKCDPCCLGKRVVLMPFETLPPPWCCCSNRITQWDNCFNLCGSPVGNPKIFVWFAPQPKDANRFVKAAQTAVLGGVHSASRSNVGSPPGSAVMER